MDNFNFDMNLDAKALVDQDPEFADYAAKALLTMLVSTKETLPLIGALHGFYNIGMTQEQVITWMKSIQLFQPPKKED